MNLTDEEKAVGRENFINAVSFHRRDFLKGALATAGVSGLSLGAMYFGYSNVDKPVRVGIIGTGDEGQVLIGGCNPKYVEVVAICDIRPSSIHRAFHGDYRTNGTVVEPRPGLMSVYDWKSEDAARQHVAVYERYQDLLEDKNVEAVIIALPLHLHHEVAMAAMAPEVKKHVLTEKLMAHNITQCKEMARTSYDAELYLATGHQRHYSILYDNAVHMIQAGMLGQLHHIRAQWHRGNLPGHDSWQKPLPDGATLGKQLADAKKKLKSLQANLAQGKAGPDIVAAYEKVVAQWEKLIADKGVNALDYGYKDIKLDGGYTGKALEELIRWRLFDRTGGGLMAELGSHQLDAASIFISALSKEKGKKIHPLTVHAVGGRHIFPLDRDAEDHVYCMFEFPAPAYDAAEIKPPSKNIREASIKAFGYHDAALKYPEQGIDGYDEDQNKKIVVTYSSINGNGFGGYGEVVMGTKGGMVLEREADVMLFGDDTTSVITLKSDKESGGPTMDTQESGPPAAVAMAAMEKPSRGYQEEIEHWAWCIRNKSPENQPKCEPKVALGDAVIALTTKLAMQRSRQKGKHGFVEFNPDWFDYEHDATPEEDLKNM